MAIVNGTFDANLNGWQSNEKVYWENGYAKFNACGSVRAFMSQRLVIDNPILSFDWGTSNNLCCPPGCVNPGPVFVLELIIHDIINGIPVDTTVISEMFPASGGGTKIKDVSLYIGRDATLQFRDSGSGWCCNTGWYTMTIDNVIISPNWGTFRVSSIPGRANIYVDDSFLNLTPETGSIDLTHISPGTHTVKITKTDYYDFTATVGVSPGRIYEIAAALNKQVGCLSFLSDPAGAKIFLSDRNGQVLNDTGFVAFKQICDLLWGDYKWKLLLDGYYPEEGTVTLNTATGAVITKTLIQIGIGCIYFTSNPTGAKIFVDNVDTGKVTPDTVCGLSLGSHHYELVLTGYLPASGDITLVSTHGGSVSLDLVTPANVISATLTVDTNDCVAPCTVNGTVSWTNNGGSSGILDPAILVNTVSTSLGSAVAINPGQTLSYAFSLPSLPADTYRVCASPDTGTTCQAIIVRTPANVISATLTVDTNDCVAPCTVNGTVSWTNNGGSSGILDPAILVNTVSTSLGSAVAINPGQTLSYAFSLPSLPADTYHVCASPDTGTTCQTIIVRTPANVISATLTVDTNDCVAPCTVNGTVSWTNTGGTASSPTDLSITVNGAPIPIDSAVVIGPGETTAVYPFTISNLAAGTYTVQAFPNAGTIPQITTVANIVATSISAIPRVLPCVQSCTVDVSVAWTNTGETAGTFIPTIKVDGIPISPAQYTSETLAPGATVTRTFVTDVLAVGSHQICADPNGTCATITVEQVVQAGFGAAGMIMLAGLAIGALYATTKKP